MSGILYLTGADRRYFTTTLCLLESFARRLPGQRLMVCDYGLDAGQRAYLEERRQYLPRPDTVPATLHPYAKKAAILAYARPALTAPDQPLCWLDGDMLVAGLDTPRMTRLLADLRAAGRDIALTTDVNGASLADIAALGDVPGLTDTRQGMTTFRALLAQSGADPAAPYISVGFWLCRSPALLESWDRLTRPVLPHPLFEQNVMALMVHGHPRQHPDGAPTPGGMALLLDPALWQPQNHLLPLLEPSGPPGRFHLRPAPPGGDRSGWRQPGDGGDVALVHCTASHHAFMDVHEGVLMVGAARLTGYFRRPRNPALRTWQWDLLAGHVRDNAAALRRHGLLHT